MLRACGRGGVEAWRSVAWEAHAAGLRTWRHGGIESYYRRADVEAQRYGDLEVCCMRVDARDMDVWRCAAGVQTWRYLPQELRRHAVGVEMMKDGGMELWRPGGMLSV